MSRSRVGLLAVLGVLGASGCSLALDFDSLGSEPVKRRPTFCEAHSTPPAIFCDDFDAEAIGTKWPKIEVMNGEVDNDADAAATSKPNSLLSIANPVGVTGRVRAVSGVSFPDVNSTKIGLRISFNLRVDQFDSAIGAKTNVFDFIYGPVTDFNQVALVLVSTGDTFSVMLAENPQTVGQPNNSYHEYGPFSVKPALGAWTRVALDLDITNPFGSGNTVRLALDDQVQLDTALLYDLKGETPRLELGVGWVDSELMATQTWAVRYDDFLVEAVAR
jgi:hypothetical protein